MIQTLIFDWVDMEGLGVYAMIEVLIVDWDEMEGFPILFVNLN